MVNNLNILVPIIVLKLNKIKNIKYKYKCLLPEGSKECAKEIQLYIISQTH